MVEYAEDIQAQMNELKEDLAKLRGDLGMVLRTMMEATKSEAGEARDRLESKAREQLDNFSSALDSARAQGRVMADRFYDQIEAHPMQSILGALGAGFLIGFMAGKK